MVDTLHWLPCSYNQIYRAACVIISGSYCFSLGLDLKYDHHHFEDDDHHPTSVVVDIFMTRSCWLPRVRGRLWGAKAVTSKYFFTFFAFSSHICCLTNGIKIAEIPKGFVLCRKLFISHCWNHNHHNGDDHHNHHYTDGDYNDVCTSLCMQSDRCSLQLSQSETPPRSLMSSASSLSRSAPPAI